MINSCFVNFPDKIRYEIGFFSEIYIFHFGLCIFQCNFVFLFKTILNSCVVYPRALASIFFLGVEVFLEGQGKEILQGVIKDEGVGGRT